MGKVKGMSDLVRKQLYITRLQDLQLKERAKEYGVTEAELVRKALDLQLNRVGFAKEPVSTWQKELAFVEEWINKGRVKGLRSWKRDDLYGV